MERSHRVNLSAGVASVAVALTLVAMKAWAVAATGSLSIAASLTDSALDLVASSGGLVGIIYAAKPPDDDHAFGHASVEDLVALGQSILVTVAAVSIGWSAVGRFFVPQALAAEAAGLWVMATSMVLTLVLVLWQGHVAKRTGSKIVAADRLHYLSDLVPAVGAMVALAASSRLGIAWLDPVIALIASVVLFRGALGIGLAAWDALMDRRADPAMIAEVEKILAAEPDLHGYHDLKTRTSGSRVFVQVHLELDGAQSLAAAHAIGARVRRTILATLPNADVIIHKDPV